MTLPVDPHALRCLDIQTPRAFVPLLRPSRYKGARGGRASCKSHFFAENLIERCLIYPRTRWLCIREIQQTLKQSSKLLLQDKIEKLGVGSHFDVQVEQIITPGDGVLSFTGMQNHTAESIKSYEDYDGSWADEAHRLSEFSLGILRPTIRRDPDGKRPGSEMWFAWNPFSPDDPIDKLFRENKDDPDFVCVETNYTDNPWLPEVTLREIERDRRRDFERYKHVWLGEYQTYSEARVFRNWEIDDFGTPETPEEWAAAGVTKRFYFGADWGFSVDPTVLVRCWIKGRTLFVDQEAWEIGCEIDHCPRLFDTVKESRKWPITADSANPQSISYMRRNGFPHMEPSIKGVGSIEEGVEFLKSFDIVVHPRCTHVIDELMHYSYEVDKQTEQVLPVLADRKNHTIDALRYAVEKLRRAGGPAGVGRY